MGDEEGSPPTDVLPPRWMRHHTTAPAPVRRGPDRPLPPPAIPTPRRPLAKLEQMRKELHESLRPFVEVSFRHHDSNGNGTLDEAEASQLFTDLVAEMTRLIQAAGGKAMRKPRRQSEDVEEG